MKLVRMLLMIAVALGISPIAQAHEPSEGESDPVQRDQLHIAVQQICPVSGQRLGEHGAPIKVTVGDQKEEVFLCCQGCLEQKIDPTHWATIHANFAAAQRICPIMKKPLPQNPKWTIVGGQIVYVCCPPCTKKIAADPRNYLNQVDALYAASLRAQPGR